jgi:hypothetical protein
MESGAGDFFGNRDAPDLGGGGTQFFSLRLPSHLSSTRGSSQRKDAAQASRFAREDFTTRGRAFAKKLNNVGRVWALARHSQKNLKFNEKRAWHGNSR